MKTAGERAREIATLTYGVPSASYGKIESVLRHYAADLKAKRAPNGWKTC